MTANEQVIALRESGNTYGQIAAALGMTRNAVAGALFRAANGGKKSNGRGHGRGECNGAAKLTEDDVKYIRASTETLRALGEKYGVRPDYVWVIRARRTWKHVA